MRYLLSVLFIITLTAQAQHFSRPTEPGKAVGRWQMITVLPGDSINAIAYAHDISGDSILRANPDIPDIDHIRVGQKILLPTCYALPKYHQGIVVNLAEHLLYYFPDGDHVWIFPVTTGRDVTPTPKGVFKIIKKSMNPPWFPPKNIRDKLAKRGIKLPKKMPPGPKNPLGKYVLYMNTSQYWIHTTPNISQLGGNRSFGCIRMYQKDIQQLYQDAPIDTQVRIISEPTDYLSIAKQCLPVQKRL